jgi:cytochrome bd-type quinol oxidase subunit 2
MTKLLNYLVLAQTNMVCNPNSTVLCNPTHSLTIANFLTNIIEGFGVLMGMVTIAMVVYSGFQMIVSQGNEEDVSQAKSSLQWSVSGLVIILLAFAIVSAIGQFFQINPNVNPNPGQIQSPILTDNITSLSRTIFNGFLSVVGLVAIFFIVVSGFRYVTARGDDEQLSQAKKGLEWAIIGLIVSALAYAIVTAISKFIQQN